MRTFLMLALKASSSPNFTPDTLVKAGRMDFVARTVSNALYVSHAIRKDTIIYIVCNGPALPPKVITFDGSKIAGLEPDERSIGAVILKALKLGINLQMEESREIQQGIIITKQSFEGLLKTFDEKTLFYLDEKGEDIREQKFEDDVVFILGDFMGLPKKTESYVHRVGATPISLGPVMLFGSHCPIIVHNELDRRGK